MPNLHPLDVAFIAATVAEEANVAKVSKPFGFTTEVLKVMFEDTEPYKIERAIRDGNYSDLYWEETETRVACVLPGVGSIMALKSDLTDWKFIAES